MKKAGVLLFVLLFVCICGCGKDGADEPEYEQISENFYARADLEAEIPTVYLRCSVDEDPVLQWLFLLYVAKPLTEMQKSSDISDFCIHYDTEEFNFVYLSSEFEAGSRDEILKTLPSAWSEAASHSYRIDDESDSMGWVENIEEKIMTPIRERYIEDESEK